MVFNDPGFIENSELSAIENVSNGNAVSPIVYNSSPTKTGKKRRLNEANSKVNVAKRLKNSDEEKESMKQDYELHLKEKNLSRIEKDKNNKCSNASKETSQFFTTSQN
ncbi:unnamed protein product [Parnassius apollo]|uniref:(apollo) hypothetical protein n=1 Tax=Parnassius apollo TaxID=110799 RepID=A0A8S3XIX4_PARAO|nr:unnamed protein product [Parnassius apollo]